MLEAKPDDLNWIPGTHMVEKTDYSKLSSDLHAHALALTSNTQVKGRRERVKSSY